MSDWVVFIAVERTKKDESEVLYLMACWQVVDSINDDIHIFTEIGFWTRLAGFVLAILSIFMIIATATYYTITNKIWKPSLKSHVLRFVQFTQVCKQTCTFLFSSLYGSVRLSQTWFLQYLAGCRCLYCCKFDHFSTSICNGQILQGVYWWRWAENTEMWSAAHIMWLRMCTRLPQIS